MYSIEKIDDTQISTEYIGIGWQSINAASPHKTN